MALSDWFTDAPIGNVIEMCSFWKCLSIKDLWFGILVHTFLNIVFVDLCQYERSLLWIINRQAVHIYAQGTVA